MPQINSNFKDVPGYEGRYAITNDGRIWSYPKQWVIDGSRGRKVRYQKGRWRKISQYGDYKSIILSRDKREKTFNVHCLVATTFLPNPDNKVQINHKNGNKLDNRVENLEWATEKENSMHAHRTGLQKTKYGEEIGSSKLTNAIVRGIRLVHDCGLMSGRGLAKAYNVCPGTISLVVNNKIWRHVSYEYPGILNLSSYEVK